MKTLCWAGRRRRCRRHTSAVPMSNSRVCWATTILRLNSIVGRLLHIQLIHMGPNRTHRAMALLLLGVGAEHRPPTAPIHMTHSKELQGTALPERMSILERRLHIRPIRMMRSQGLPDTVQTSLQSIAGHRLHMLPTLTVDLEHQSLALGLKLTVGSRLHMQQIRMVLVRIRQAIVYLGMKCRVGRIPWEILTEMILQATIIRKAYLVDRLTEQRGLGLRMHSQGGTTSLIARI
mmetsp:Transcript_7950/g.23965  ORF Transcript_7950/g.23965 Transcript_7950/m.23965 type:complete len:234 (-) Transcript_7950:1897-2598(-)